MLYRTIITVLFSLFVWFYGASLHKNKTFNKRHKSRFPEFIERALYLGYIDRRGLTFQFLAIWILSCVLFIIEIISLEEWRKVAVPVILCGLFFILVFTNWGWWRK
jgi:hypothetical protein